MPESYTGSEGTDAALAGFDVMDGAEKWGGTNGGWRAINKTRDMIAHAIDAVKTWATSVFVPKTDVVTSDGSTSLNGKIPRYTSGVRLVASNPINPGDVATKAYVDASTPTFNGGTISGQLNIPNAYAAATGYVVAYWDGVAGRISKGASTERVKDGIQLVDPRSLGNIFPDLYEFWMKDDPGQMHRIGWIAERLNESDDLRRFVVYEREPITEDVYETVLEDVYDDEGEVIGQEEVERFVETRVIDSRLKRDENGNTIPESIDFISLFIAMFAQLRLELDER